MAWAYFLPDYLTICPIDRFMFFYSICQRMGFLLFVIIVSKQKKGKALLVCFVPLRCALPEDYNIHQNWKIAVEIYQFGPLFQPFRWSHTDNPGRSITLFFFHFSFTQKQTT
jgi:hypothetical protein